MTSATRPKIPGMLLEVFQNEESGVRLGEVTKNFFFGLRLSSFGRACVKSCAFLQKMGGILKVLYGFIFKCDVFTALICTI